MAKLCPSAQPGMDQCRVLGVVRHDARRGRWSYAESAARGDTGCARDGRAAQTTEVFRLAATCAEHRCPHFDGADCQLATRIVNMLPAAVDSLPPCLIRKECRWYTQEGDAACRRCPAITTRDLRSVQITRGKSQDWM